MSWSIERRHDHVAVVTMNTNKVNAQNPAFFAGPCSSAAERSEAAENMTPATGERRLKCD